MARLVRSLVTFVDGSEDKATSTVIAATSKHTSGWKTFINAIANKHSPLAALAIGVGLAEDTLSQEYRNNGVDPTRLNAEMTAHMQALGVPDDAGEANDMLAGAEEASRGGVIPTWALVGAGLLALTMFGGAGYKRARKRGFKGFRRPSFKFKRPSFRIGRRR